MSFLESALKLAKKGFHVFPVKVNSKEPYLKKFPVLATRDETQIKKWWVDSESGEERAFNIGVSTTRYGDDEALVAVDVDDKGKKKGSEQILLLELKGFYFNDTFTQKTPTGGRHMVYRAKEPVKQGESVLAHGLDIRSRGGYILGPGSQIDGVSYEEVEGFTEIAECPEWIVDKCKIEKPKKVHVDAAIDYKRAKKRIKQYLTKEAPVAIEGDGGDELTYKVAARLKDLGADKLTALESMLAYWNDRCSPPWAPEELEKKIDNAYQYSQNDLGVAAPETQFTAVEEDPSCEQKSFLERMNESYALLFGEGNHSILNESVDEKGRPIIKILNEPSFKRLFSPKKIQQGRGKALSWAELWLDWDGRREYNGLCFKPEQEPKNGYYNTWRGFTCEPLPYEEAGEKAKRGFDLFIEHALENVCNKDEKLFTWLMGYLAHLVQKPWERPLTTLVFRGKKGVGKNALMDRVGSLIGRSHYLVAHNSRYLTSNFNGHMDSALCLVLDEAFWSGDKSAEGQLKGITTAPEIMIERKNKEPYVVDNLTRLVVIGNEDWLVPASNDERRYAVFDVGTGRQQDRDYFRKMRILLDKHEGNRVLLNYFKTFDLSTVDVNGAPATKGLLEQKISSLDLIEEFWFNCLSDERIIDSEFSEGWPEKIGKTALRDAFYIFCRKKNSRARMPSDVKFGKKLCQMCPPLKKKVKIKDGTSWVHGYEMPLLEECRELLEDWLGHEIDWG